MSMSSRMWVMWRQLSTTQLWYSAFPSLLVPLIISSLSFWFGSLVYTESSFRMCVLKMLECKMR